ncbi:MAG: signal peptidase II [Sphingomonadaceae bacterium]|nr:signal peptidase II [Sphingomonadaceae bacterium]
MNLAPRHRTLGLIVAATILLVDQLSKYAVIALAQLPARGRIDLLPFLDFTWVENRGVSLGMLTASSELQRWLLVALTALISVGVAIWLWRERKAWDAFALALVLGGAIGNIIDRVRYGYVADFIDLHIGEFRPFLIFNVSDSAITIGVVVLLLRALLIRDKAEPTETSDA